MSNHNLQICENEKFVSLPYDKINFLISEKFIEGTTAWHDFESNINELNWDNLDKIPFLDKEVPYLSFDLIAELFNLNSKKDDAVKVLHSICQLIWKTQQWPQDWKRSVFIQYQKKAMPKNAQTTAQLHSSHTLLK